jgi:myo-inositol-1(or 4)-monophosphatase
MKQAECKCPQRRPTSTPAPKRTVLHPSPPLLSQTDNFQAADLVTETDQAVELMVSTKLRSAYPTFEFIGEETYKPGMTLTDAPTFICDPIDGTTNFVHAFPAFCISLGFVVKKVPSVGVIYNPYLDELYTAIKDHGAFLTRNGKEKIPLPLKKNPEPLKDLSTCLIGAEWGSDRSGVNFELKAKVMAKLAASKENGGAMVHSIRCMGSAALNLAAVAAGQQDVFWEGGCWAWDVAAGWCILTEAGGIMASGNPGDWNPTIDGRKYLAIRGAPSGQKEIVEEFWKVVGDGRMEYES